MPQRQPQAHVLVAGDGPPVVLLNGIGVPAAMMAQIGGVTQFAIDHPAFGLSDTTAHFADDLRVNAVRFLVEVFDGLGLERPVVVANSLGSLWSSWLAIDRPDRVLALAHVGCPAKDPATVGSSGRTTLQTGTRDPLPPEIARLILATERLSHFEHAFLTMLRRLVRLRGSRPETALTAEQLAQIQAPTLLVFADDDPMGASAVGRRVADAMGDAELHIVEGGHAPWIHHADQIAPHLSAFLERVGHATS